MAVPGTILGAFISSEISPDIFKILFATTVNQELSDVLKSNVRAFLILPGTVDGKEPSDENIVNTINYLMSDESQSSSEVIFCPDETR